LNSPNELYAKLAEAVAGMDAASVRSLAVQALAEGLPAEHAIEYGLAAGMNEVGRRFACGDYYVPEGVVAAQAMNAGFEILKEKVSREALPNKGTVVIGVARRDVHDIGKNIVRLMIEASGFAVIDLGRSAPPEKFAETAVSARAQIVAVSTLMTTTLDSVAQTAELIKRDHPEIKLMVGGAPVTSAWAKGIGADFYGANAREAVVGAHQLAGVPLVP